MERELALECEVGDIYQDEEAPPSINEDTMALSVLQDIRPMIETVPLEKAAQGYERMQNNQARFRAVIVMSRPNSASPTSA